KQGYSPRVMLSGRAINDGMGRFIAQKTIKELIHSGHNIRDSLVTILGLTCKENCRDLRNTRVVDIVAELQDYGVQVQVCDPQASAREAEKEYHLRLQPLSALKPAHAVILAAPHQEFVQMTPRHLKRLAVSAPPGYVDIESARAKTALEAAD